MNFSNEWFDFCEYIKTTTNFDILRSILLSSLTIGIPQFVIEYKDEYLILKRINQDDLDSYLTKIEYSEIKKFKNSTASTVSVKGKNSSSIPNSPKKILRLQVDSTNDKQLPSIISSQSNSKTADLTELYEPYIDSLLDLTDLIDLSRSQTGDSTNLLLISRALILIDLMKNLDDKYFHENISYSLCQLINNIVVQVIRNLFKIYSE